MQYDTIAPRVHLFGIYLTRTLVSSILLALVGAVAPKAWSYFYDHMWLLHFIMDLAIQFSDSYDFVWCKMYLINIGEYFII